MTRQLNRTIIASAVFSVALAALLVTVGSILARPTIQDTTLTSMVRGFDVEACEADPEGFGRGTAGLSLFAYDDEGRSAHPDAPPIEEALLREAARTRKTSTREADGEVVSVLPLGDEGACAFARVSYGRLASVARATLFAVLVLATTGGMLLSAIGTYGLVVRPLHRRIASLAAAARAVGTSAFAAQPESADALGSIAEVLTETDMRVKQHRDALEQRNVALADHLAGIAHDLRTPLASLHLALESLSASAARQPEATRALSDVVYLSALVENLHQAARLRHDADIRAGVVDLGALIRRLEQRFVLVGSHAGIAVAASIPDHPVWTACTPAFAERALANIVQNAVEHNHAPGHVAITLKLARDGRSFELEILDDGPGLPPHAVASLSEATFLTEAARTRGPGLGMLITGEVARRAGWMLTHEPRAVGHAVRVRGAVSEPEASAVTADAGALNSTSPRVDRGVAPVHSTRLGRLPTVLKGHSC